MTENEAQDMLDRFWEFAICGEEEKVDILKNVTEAVNIAIQALEEIQQYRAIGTVEEFKNAKRSVHIADMAVGHIEKGKQEIRAKAIDEFAERLHDLCGYEEDGFQYPYLLHESRIDEIAEQLKAGGNSENQ